MDRNPIVRKPISDNYCRRNAEFNPQFLDTETLMAKFEPLFKSIYKRFCSFNGVFNTPTEQADLYNQIIFEFLSLRQKYDPKRGVDFPGYIQFHLQKRIYHYVTKTQKVQFTEQLLKSYDDNEDKQVEMESYNLAEEVDKESEEEYNKALALASIPWDCLDDEEEDLIKQILVEQKSIEVIAKEQNVPIKSIKDRLDAVCEVLELVSGGYAYD